METSRGWAREERNDFRSGQAVANSDAMYGAGRELEGAADRVISSADQLAAPEGWRWRSRAWQDREVDYDDVSDAQPPDYDAEWPAILPRPMFEDAAGYILDDPEDPALMSTPWM